MSSRHLSLVVVVIATSLAGCGSTPQDTGTTTDAAELSNGIDVLPTIVRTHALRHIQTVARDGRATKWSGASLSGPVVALYRPDVSGPAYYEVGVSAGGAAAGFMVLSTGSHDAPVVQWSDAGERPTVRLDAEAASSGLVPSRYYRIDHALYAAESSDGTLVAASSHAFIRYSRSDTRKTRLVPVGWDAVKAAFDDDDAHAALARNRARYGALFGAAATVETSTLESAGSCIVAGSAPLYGQMPAYSSFNTSSCWSGCGATAWAMLFGWASREAALGMANPAFVDIFRAGGGGADQPQAIAPVFQDSSVERMTWELREELTTFCFFGSGATYPADMGGGASSYLARRTSQLDVWTDYSSFLWSADSYRDMAIQAVCAGVPAVVGTGTLFGGDGHYPLAMGYGVSNGVPEFWLDMGWGGDGNGWYTAETYFYGTLMLR